jgi:predicted DCC family thiol-disulfide oxidoreductase YuxK
MRKLDRTDSIVFSDLSSTTPEACPIDRRALLERFHAREDGRLVQGAEAFAAMWRAIPLLRPFGLLARNPRILRGLQWLYGRFLRVRPRMQALARRFD